MSIDAIQERAENIETTQQLSDIFVDPNILNRLVQNKNQIVFGRRGTGKTHLLGRMREYYWADIPLLKKKYDIFRIEKSLTLHKHIIDIKSI